MKTYEAMFLMDPALASDWAAAEAEIRRVLDRAGAEVVGVRSWDERKLAYEINRHKRGLYVLTFFRAGEDKITGIERDVQLGEKFLRVLVLRRERMTGEQIQKALSAGPPPKSAPRSDEWSGGWRGEGGRERGGVGRRGEGGGRGPKAEAPPEPAPVEEGVPA